MIGLYNIDDGFKILDFKKKINVFLVCLGFVISLLVTVITFVSSSYFIMVVDVILVTGYLWILYTYLFYFRKKFNEEYHFLAKVEQFEHDYVCGNIDLINEDIITVKNLIVYSLSINDRTVFIEVGKIPDVFYDVNKIKLDVVDNFVVGYEVVYEE